MWITIIFPTTMFFVIQYMQYDDQLSQSIDAGKYSEGTCFCSGIDSNPAAFSSVTAVRANYLANTI